MSRTHRQPELASDLACIIDACRVNGVAVVDGVDAIEAELGKHNDGTPPNLSIKEVVERTIGTGSAGWDSQIGTIDDYVSALMLLGVDGERFVQSLIRFESQNHTKLVWLEANRMAARLRDRSAEDLLGWGWLGLRLALRQFDPTRGFKFSTYACYRIKGAIRDGVRDENPIPKRLITLQRKAALAHDELSGALGRPPTLEEVAAEIDERVEVLSELLPRLRPEASVDELLFSEDAQRPLEELIDRNDPSDEALIALRREAVASAVAGLPGKQRIAVELVLLNGTPLIHARQILDVSDRELKRLLTSATESLTARLSDWADS